MHLFVSYSGAFGGAEQVLISFAGALDADRCLACPEGRLADAARQAGIRVLALPARRLDLRTTARDRAAAMPRLAAHAIEVRRLIRELAPNLVVAWGMRSAIASLGWGARCPLVLAHHDLLPGRLIAGLVRAAARRSALVVVPSRTVAEDLGVPCEVVQPGVEVERFASCAAPVAPPEVLVLGAISRMKRPDLAFEIYARARALVPGLRLRLMGEPVALDGERLAVELATRAGMPDVAGGVEFAGAVSDVGPALSRAVCLLHCADREPFGLAMLEALAAARPVVAPAAGGALEILDGSCAVLYPAGDVSAAAEGVAQLVHDPGRAAAMGSAGRALVRARFDRRAAAGRFAELMARVG